MAAATATRGQKRLSASFSDKLAVAGCMSELISRPLRPGRAGEGRISRPFRHVRKESAAQAPRITNKYKLSRSRPGRASSTREKKRKELIATLQGLGLD